MKLTSVEVHGFKSFALKTRLDFGLGITAVIGPNGSGKSNLAEAIRWVLGEQSLKSLRGKQSTDVIFSGTDGRGQARRASVLLTFDNESGRFPLEMSEVTIGRVLHRDGESDYLVNGESVRLLDLQQMLAEAGIGTKSYTVISQGMVDRYLMASPEVRRELFDEATGVKALQLKMHQAERKLVRTRQHAHEVQTVIEELAPRLRVLQRQVKRQEEKDQLVVEFETGQRAWFFHTWHEALVGAQQAESAVMTTTDAISTARGERQRVEKAMFAAASKGMPGDHLREQLVGAEADFRSHTSEYDQAEQRRVALVESLVEIEDELRQAEVALSEKRESSLHFDWLKQVRGLLNTCRDALKGTLSKGEVDSLNESIEGFLSRVEDTSSVEMAKSVLQQMEEPLTQVARLKAIMEERKQQLKNIADVGTPDDTKVKRLLAMIESQGEVTLDVPQESMEVVREAELSSEREGSAAKAALLGAQQELVRVEQDILREMGSGLLADIKKNAVKEIGVLEKPSFDHLHQLESRIASLGEIDELVVKEYGEVKERYEHLQQQMEDVLATEQNIVELQGQLTVQIEESFGKQFAVIDKAFRRYFVALFGGGKSGLSVGEGGIDIVATPPGKKARAVSLLSGGEKALTSLALLLAILEAQQPPFVVLDEVDAALDEANSERLAQILQERSVHTQTIVISHNRSTMAAASVLYGVTMQKDGVSKVYSVKLDDIEGVESVEEMDKKILV